MAIAKLGQIAVKALTSAKGATSVYKQGLAKLANIIPDMKPTTFSMDEIQTILKFKGIQDQSVFEAGQVLLGKNATLTIAKKASRLHEGSSMLGAVVRNSDGEIVVKGAALIDDTTGACAAKVRSGLFDWNARYNPNNVNAEELVKSSIKISTDMGAIGKETLDLKCGRLLDTVADDVATACGIKKSVVLQDSGDFLKKQLLEGADPRKLAQELSEKYSVSDGFCQQKSKFTQAIEKLIAPKVQLEQGVCMKQLNPLPPMNKVDETALKNALLKNKMKS